MPDMPDLRSLTVILSAECNLRCAYCYQDAKRPLAMPWPVLRRAIDLLDGSTRVLKFEFHEEFETQIGGVAIYFGAQMREAGDYPYTLPLGHPRFMSDSHFNPRFSPIAGHWRMLVPVSHVQRIHPAALPAARPGSPRANGLQASCSLPSHR